MSNENANLIRRAYQAYASGDLQAMLQFVDPDLEWTYLDPGLEDPQPEVCNGRHELESALQRQAGPEPGRCAGLVPANARPTTPGRSVTGARRRHTSGGWRRSAWSASWHAPRASSSLSGMAAHPPARWPIALRNSSAS